MPPLIAARDAAGPRHADEKSPALPWRLNPPPPPPPMPTSRDLHSSTCQLNVSTFCGIRWVDLVNKTAQIEPQH
jgi:hypothetical protein